MDGVEGGGWTGSAPNGPIPAIPSYYHKFYAKLRVGESAGPPRLLLVLCMYTFDPTMGGNLGDQAIPKQIGEVGMDLRLRKGETGCTR